MSNRRHGPRCQVLVVRAGERFTWQIRYERFAKAVRVSAGDFGSQEEAAADGRIALARFEKILNGPGS